LGLCQFDHTTQIIALSSLKGLPLNLYTFGEITISSKTDYLGTNHVRQLPKARGVPSPAAVLDLNFDWTHDQPEPELELKKVTKQFQLISLTSL
jgi:hypothetical protein